MTFRSVRVACFDWPSANGEKRKKICFENSDDERKKNIGNPKKKAINASSKFKHSLKKKVNRRKSDGRVNSVSIEVFWDTGKLKTVKSFRQALIMDELLRENFDDYHMLLSLSTSSTVTKKKIANDTTPIISASLPVMKNNSVKKRVFLRALIHLAQNIF